MRRPVLWTLFLASCGVLSAGAAPPGEDPVDRSRPVLNSPPSSALPAPGDERACLDALSNDPEQNAPEWFKHRNDKVSAAGELRTIVGRFGADKASAKLQARKSLEEAVHRWLGEAGISHSWKPPSKLIDGLILDTHVHTDVRPEYTVYLAAHLVDFSGAKRNKIFQVYEREVVGRRLVVMVGGLTFLLASLAGLAGYIRADEATKGYYTNRLRLLAAAGVGAAGVAIYKLLA
jgi:hypothetical protein